MMCIAKGQSKAEFVLFASETRFMIFCNSNYLEETGNIFNIAITKNRLKITSV